MTGEKAPRHILQRVRRRATGRCRPSPPHASPRHYTYLRHSYPVTRSIRSTFAKTTRSGASGERAFSLSPRFRSIEWRIFLGVAISQGRIFRIVHAHKDDSTRRKRWKFKERSLAVIQGECWRAAINRETSTPIESSTLLRLCVEKTEIRVISTLVGKSIFNRSYIFPRMRYSYQLILNTVL